MFTLDRIKKGLTFSDVAAMLTGQGITDLTPCFYPPMYVNDDYNVVITTHYPTYEKGGKRDRYYVDLANRLVIRGEAQWPINELGMGSLAYHILMELDK